MNVLTTAISRAKEINQNDDVHNRCREQHQRLCHNGRGYPNNSEVERFTSAKQLNRLAAKWPATRLWRSGRACPANGPLRNSRGATRPFTHIWDAIQTLVPDPVEPAARVAPKEARTRKRATASDEATTRPAGSKTAQIIELLKQQDGATSKDVMSATGWQAHSVRGSSAARLGKR